MQVGQRSCRELQLSACHDGRIKLTATLIVSCTKATAARRLDTRLYLLPPGGQHFRPSARHGACSSPIGGCHSGKRRAASLAGCSFVPPTLLALFVHAALLWRARNTLRARQTPASSARGKHYAW